MMRNSIPCLGIIRIRCKGFDLSLSFNPQADKAPLLVSAAKIRLFSIGRKKFKKNNYLCPAIHDETNPTE